MVHPEQRHVIGTKDAPDVRYELLTRDTRGSIEFCMMVIPPHLSSYRDAKSHAGEEVAYVCAGEQVELNIGGTLYPMSRGDSVRIPANAPTPGTTQPIPRSASFSQSPRQPFDGCAKAPRDASLGAFLMLLH